MALTPKIKLLRVLSVLQTWIAVWLMALGIVEQVRVVWTHSGVGLAIWTGVWVGITGAFGVFITFKRVQNLSRGSQIPSHLVMTFMGFSLTCGILTTLYLYVYSYELSVAGTQQLRLYSISYGEDDVRGVERHPVTFNSRYKEQHALVGSIFGFMVVELILAMWSVGICLVNDRQQMLSEDEPGGLSLMSASNQGQSGTSVASRFGYTPNF